MFWVFGAVIYLNIGYWWGRLAWEVWDCKDKESFASFICFPASHILGDIGDDKTTIVASFPIERYATGMAFLWPIRAAINLILMTLIGVFRLPKLATLPIKLTLKKFKTKQISEDFPEAKIVESKKS